MRRASEGLVGRARREWLALGLLLLLAAMLLVWARARSHDDIDSAERAHLSHQVAGLERILALQLGSVRNALHGVRDGLGNGSESAQWTSAQQRFRTVHTAIAGLSALRWLDASGHVVAGDDAAPAGADLSNRDDFRSARDRPDPGALIVAPPKRNAGDAMSLDLAVPILGADGRFAGIVAATLDPVFFDIVLASALYANDMRAVVIHGDGGPVTYLPRDPSRYGRNVARPGSLFNRFRETGLDALVVEGAMLGTTQRRLVAFRFLRPAALAMDKPLVIAVSRPTLGVFADWQESNWVYATIFGAGAMAAWTSLLAFQRRRAERHVHESAERSRRAADDERLELALRGADLALWDLHVPTRRVNVNARWHSMLGRTPGPAHTEPDDWEQLLHPEDRERVLQARDDHIAGRTPSFDSTYRLRHVNGDWIWVVNRGRAVERDAGGRAVRVVGTNLDATQLFAAEAALRRSEQDLAITLQSIGDGVIATDTAGTITRLNAAAETLTGWRAADALGQPLHGVFRIVDAATRAAASDPVGPALARGETVARGEAVLLVARDGHERHVSDRAAPIRDAAGAVAGVVLVFSDVSRHQAALQALRESEHQLQTLTAALPGPVARFGLDGRCLFTNATCERWFGKPAQECLGSEWDEVFPRNVANELAPHMASARRGLAGTFDLTLPTLGGEREAMASVVPDRDAHGTLQGCIVTMTDVTDRKRAEDALRESEERSRSLLDSLRSGVLVYGADGVIVDANPSACRILEMPREALVGLRADDPRGRFFEEDGSPMRPERRPLAHVLATGEPINGLMLGLRIAPAGAARRLVWLLCSAFAVRDREGRVQQVVVTFVDVTERMVAQERLLESEERLRMASRLARLGGWRFELASRRVALAPESVALIGAAAAGPDTDPDGFAAAMVPADRARWSARLQRAIDDGLPIDDEFVAVGAEGRTAHWRILGEAVRDAAGRLVGVQGAVQDVTEEREAQQLLRLLEAAVASLNDAVVITEASADPDVSPPIVFVNEAFERMSGYSRAELIGRPPRMLLGPESQGPELERIRQARRDRLPVHVEFVQYRRDGSLYWLDFSMVPLFDDSGRTTHFVSAQRDITERRQAAAAVEAAQRELAATLAAVPDLLFDIDLEGGIHQCHSPPNGARDFEAARVVGRSVDSVFPSDAAEVILAALHEARDRGRSAGRQYDMPTRAGVQSFELSVSGKPVPAGDLPRFVVLARDVSERRLLESQRQMLERQLREAQKMESIGTLAGGIAHDFNNILAAILGNLALAREEIETGHPAQSTLDQIGKASIRARSLVQQILAFSRRQLNPLRPRALKPVVEETIGLLRATLPAAVRLESRLADEPLVVSADATQLQQVLMNLCTNAWQALREGRGRIEIGLERLDTELRIADLEGEGPWVHLSVSDEGTGMDAVTRERIFDPFFTTKPVGQGTGLGLSVVHGIVRNHHGTVAVESTLGRGSTFHVYLPLVDEAENREADSNFVPLAPLGPRDTDGDAPSGGEHLLYVDDDEVMVLMVERLLQRDGYRVTGCSGALEALRQVARPASDFDLVISDFNMPEMSGIDFAERLRRLRPDLPMIITSGFLTDDLRDEALALGVRALLQKEHTLEELGGLVRQVLAGATTV